MAVNIGISKIRNEVEALDSETLLNTALERRPSFALTEINFGSDLENYTEMTIYLRSNSLMEQKNGSTLASAFA